MSSPIAAAAAAGSRDERSEYAFNIRRREFPYIYTYMNIIASDSSTREKSKADLTPRFFTLSQARQLWPFFSPVYAAIKS